MIKLKSKKEKEDKCMKVSDYIIDFLAKKNIDKVFSYIGKNAHLCDSIDKHNAIENVFTLHEQAAGFAAEAYARVTGKTGVASTTSGPGATNLVTAIGSCFFDSVPTMFITGQVNTYECQNASECEHNAPVRQIGFQETDIVSIVKPITKYAVLIDGLHNLRYELEKAYFLSQEGRKGPVLIDLPLNLTYRDYNPENEKSFYDSKTYKEACKEKNISDNTIEKALELIVNSRRPVILVGGGARMSDVESELMTLLNKTNIPVVYSLMGKDLIKVDYKYNLGFIGSYGNRYANLTLANSDLLIVLGSRLDARQTGRQLKTFAREAKIIQVDLDKHEIGRALKIDLPIYADVKNFINKLNTKNIYLNIEPWLKKVLSYKERYSPLYTIDKKEKIPNKIISHISRHLKADDIICIDVGIHQMWAAQSLEIRGEQRALFSGGMGAMGFALPAAIGSTLATGKRAIVIVGDGGFQINIQELEIVKRRRLPIKIFIMNNALLGMVSLMQNTHLDKNLIGTKDDYSVPNFKNIGNAYGIKSYEASHLQDIYDLIKMSLDNDNSEIIDIQLDECKDLLEPTIALGRPMEDMSPFLSETELKEQMVIKPLDK